MRGPHARPLADLLFKWRHRQAAGRRAAVRVDDKVIGTTRVRQFEEPSAGSRRASRPHRHGAAGGHARYGAPAAGLLASSRGRLTVQRCKCRNDLLDDDVWRKPSNVLRDGCLMNRSFFGIA